MKNERVSRAPDAGHQAEQHSHAVQRSESKDTGLHRRLRTLEMVLELALQALPISGYHAQNKSRFGGISGGTWTPIGTRLAKPGIDSVRILFKNQTMSRNYRMLDYDLLS